MISSMTHLYKLLSLGFAYPHEENRRMFDGLLSVCADSEEDDLSTWLQELKTFEGSNLPSSRERESEYLRIFDMGMVVSPYETEYLSEKISRKPFELADIAGFYQAFGFDADSAGEMKEPVDHIAVELEFMAILAWKERHAQETGHEEHAKIVQAAQKKFLHEHLARWGYIFCNGLRNTACDDYYKKLAEILESVLQRECEKHGLDISLYPRDAGRYTPAKVNNDESVCGQQLPAGGI